jgi:DNA-binding NtrC family response regulator
VDGDVGSKTGTSTEPLGAADVEAIRRLREQLAGPPAALVYHGGGAEHVPMPEGRSVVIGREAEIAIDDSNLSRSHARLVNEAGAMILEDLDSTNGSWIDGERVRRAALRPGEVVCIGSPRVVVQLLRTQGDLIRPIQGHDAFNRAIAQEVAAASERGGRVAVLVARSYPERTHLHRWYERSALVLPEAAVTGLYTSDTLEILVPGMSLREAGELAQRICSVQASYGTQLVAGAASFPEGASDAIELLAAALDALEQAAAPRPVNVAPLRAALRGGGGPLTDIVQTGAFFGSNARTLDRLAQSPVPLLLLGATGTGKEVVARLLHARGPRADRPFIAVHCGALPEGVLASELFGHVKGAFTGATADKEGLFRAASGGTIFLDEIGEAPPAVQVSLLRALESRAVRPVGGTKEIAVDVRVIAATHRDLEAMAREGRFREDLYYRLCVLSFVLPRLADRRDEIEPIALRFVAEANAVSGGQVAGISPDALAMLRRYDWPGNIRELRNIIRRAAVLAETSLVMPADLPDTVRLGRERLSSGPPPPLDLATPTEPIASDERERIRMEQRARMLDALQRTGQNQTKAAELLGIPRRTFVYRMKALGLSKRYDGD